MLIMYWNIKTNFKSLCFFELLKYKWSDVDLFTFLALQLLFFEALLASLPEVYALWNLFFKVYFDTSIVKLFWREHNSDFLRLNVFSETFQYCVLHKTTTFFSTLLATYVLNALKRA